MEYLSWPVVFRMKQRSYAAGVKMQMIAASLFLALVGAMATEAFAQPNPNQLVASRKGAMNLQGKYLSPMLAMTQGRAPYDARIVQRNADYLAVLTQLAWDDFQPHTAGVANTRAKEEIYKDQAKFRAGIETLQADVQKLVGAARSGDQNAVKAAASGVGRTCNSCHEAFATFEFRFRVE
jgi:cytochrome c556